MPKLINTLCCCLRPNVYKKSDTLHYDANTSSGRGSPSPPLGIITQVTKGQPMTVPVALKNNNFRKSKKQPQVEQSRDFFSTVKQNTSGNRNRAGNSSASNENFLSNFNSLDLLQQQRLEFKEDYLLTHPHLQDRHKKCLIVDLDETLVHSSFKPVKNADFVIPVEIDNVVHQVYVLKRPYADVFLERVGALFECVLFTASLAKYADPVADLLDKQGTFRARLFREACVFYQGNYVKDLDRLGRDLEKVVIIDNSPASYAFHPENAVPVKTWFDDPHDNQLLELIPLLERLAQSSSVYNILGGGGNSLFISTQAVPAINPQPTVTEPNNNMNLITHVASPTTLITKNFDAISSASSFPSVSANTSLPINSSALLSAGPTQTSICASTISGGGSNKKLSTTTTFTISTISSENNNNNNKSGTSSNLNFNNYSSTVGVTTRIGKKIREDDSIRMDGVR